MSTANKQKLLDYLTDFLSENKKELFEKIIANRTKHITVALEDIYQSQNASAVLRSCDVFGIQDVHIIENNNKYTLNPKVVHGASKWINLYKYNKEENNTVACIEHLKSEGYKVYGTTPHQDDYNVQNVPIDEKIALLFGTEMHGISEIAKKNVDGFVKIPMVGFTESLNISVAAAISVFELTKRMKESELIWQLSNEEKIEQLITWSKKVIKDGSTIEQLYLSTLK